MNARDRFDLEISEAMAELAGPTVPDYIDDVLGLTKRTSQRPAWAIPERWLNVTAIADRLRFIPTGSLRPVGILLVLVLLLAAALVAIVGSRPSLPPPFGLAGNGQIAYVESGDLRVLDPVSGTSRVLNGGHRTASMPMWSLDGTRVAFLRGDPGSPQQLVVVNADGGELVELSDEDLGGVEHLAWSPDGRSIAIGHTVGAADAISIVPVDGSAELRTLDLDLAATAPAWRPPDGRQLLFRGALPDGRSNLYVVNADGSGVQSLELTSPGLDPTLEFHGAAWSPDGSKILYGGLESMSADGEQRFRSHIVNADGTAHRIIDVPPGLSHVWPRWSPDGRSFLFEIVRGEYLGEHEIWLGIAATDGSTLMEVRDLVDSSGIGAVWSPDGTSIVALYRNQNRVYRIDAVTGRSVELPVTTEFDIAWQRVADKG